MNDQLRTVVANTLGLEEQRVEASLERGEDNHWDSLAHLRLITAVEETFGIQFSMAEIESIDTVARLDELVEAHAGSAAAAHP